MKLKVQTITITERGASVFVSDESGEAHQLDLGYDELCLMLEHTSAAIRSIENGATYPKRAWMCSGLQSYAPRGDESLYLNFEFGVHGYLPLEIPKAKARAFAHQILSSLDDLDASLQ